MSGQPINRSHITAQVLIARYLFREGIRALDSKLPYSTGLAVSLFQDAAELILACVAHAVDAKPQSTFLGYWDAIYNGALNKDRKEVPSKMALGRLNNARVAFKHYGTQPQLPDVRTFAVDTEVFLKETALRFLDVELDGVSLTDLILSEAVRKSIKEAEEYLANDRYREGFLACALASSDITQSVSALIPTIDAFALRRGADGLDGLDEGAARRAIEHIARHLDAHRIALLLLLCNVDAAKYARFRAIVPVVSRAYSGKAYFDWLRPMNNDTIQCRSDLEFCIEFVTSFALGAQGTGELRVSEDWAKG